MTVALLLLPHGSVAEHLRATNLPPCSGSVLSAFAEDQIMPSGRGSNGYVAPDEQTLRVLEGAVSSVLAEIDATARAPDWTFALHESALAGYELCAGQGEESGLVLFQPIKAGLGQALFAIRVASARGLIIEVPHTVFDHLTLEQGVALFQALDARALIVAGSHRCASTRASGCDGASSACGSVEAYRDSDMAHATDSVFHLAHQLVANAHEDDLVLSLHGMEARGVVISDGTTSETSSTSAIARLEAELVVSIEDEPVVSCRGLDDPDADELCGTSNVQGRHLNGAANACTEPARLSSGRFIHLEQSRSIRRKNQQVIEALDRMLGD